MKALKLTVGAAVFSGMLSVSSLALAQGCCGGTTGRPAEMGCGMAGHTNHNMAGHADHGIAQATTSGQAVAPRQLLQKPVQSVFDNYLQVQGALALDSVEGVGATATAMAKASRDDARKTLSLKVAEQAEALAKAKDLESARQAFKPLSESLIHYLHQQKLPPGTYYEAYCPMAKASWLQTNKTIINPYMGKGMVHCGQIKD